MSAEAVGEETWTAGFYGKLPSRADFVGRYLAPDFVQVWDAWMQPAMAASRRDLGEQRWAECYVEAPLWRFAFTEHACGGQPHIGVMTPSMDKVGRYFPLVVAHPVEHNMVLLDGVAGICGQR